MKSITPFLLSSFFLGSLFGQSYWSAPQLIAPAFVFYDPVMITVAGHPAITYNYSSNVMYVRALDECGQTWGTPINIGSFYPPSPSGYNPSIAIVDGRPAIAFFGANMSDLIYVRSDDAFGNSWSNFKVVDSIGNTGNTPELRMVNGRPAIAHVDKTSNCSPFLKYVRANDALGDTWGVADTIRELGCGWSDEIKFETINGNPALLFYNNDVPDMEYVRANDVNGDTWPGVDTLPAGKHLHELSVVNNLPVALLTLGNDSLAVMFANDINGSSWGVTDTLNVNYAIGDWASWRIFNDTIRVTYSNYNSSATFWQIQSHNSQPLAFSAPEAIFNPVFYNISNDVGEYCGNVLAIFISNINLYLSIRDQSPCSNPPTFTAPDVTHPSCSPPTGSITVNASGSGALEYSVGISDFQANPTFSALPPGSYNLRARLISDPTCMAVYPGNPVVLNAVPSPPTVNAPTVTQPTCSITAGKIVVNAVPGNYCEYSIDNGATFQTSKTFNNLPGGNYYIQVRLQAHPTCWTNYANNPVVINNPPVPPVVNAPTVTQPTCQGTAGTIEVNATGNGTLLYSINGGTNYFTSPIFTNLSPGNYNIKVRLQNYASCTTSYVSNPVVLNVATPPTVNAPTVVQPTCAVPSGTIGVNASGVSALEYSVDGGSSYQTSATFSGLPPGDYNIVVRLQNNHTCTTAYSNPVNINAVPTPPNLNGVTATPPTCAVPTGSIVVSASGNGTLEHSINNGSSYQTSDTFPSLTAGSYNVRVRLQAQPTCQAVFAGNPVVFMSPSPPDVPAPGVTQPTCAVSAGTIQVNASGNGALEYSVNDGASYLPTSLFSGLPAGNYHLKVRLIADTTCLTAFAGNPVIIQPAPAFPTMNAPGVTQPTDCDSLFGAIEINAAGNGVLEYSADDGASWQTSASFSDLPLGEYDLVVRLQADSTCLENYAGNPVSILAPAGCCLPATYTNACNSGDYVEDFTFGAFANLNTGCANPGSNNLSSYLGMGPNVQLGESYQVVVGAGANAQYFGVYIDFNQNENYLDAGEFFDIGQALANGTTTGNIAIPSAALLGTSTMRVRSSFAAPLTAADGCTTNLDWGEMEDYNIYLFCPNTLAVDAVPIAAGMYQADVEITSLGKVESGSSVIFQAGISMQLLEGFEVEAGGLFEVLMQGCF